MVNSSTAYIAEVQLWKGGLRVIPGVGETGANEAEENEIDFRIYFGGRPCPGM